MRWRSLMAIGMAVGLAAPLAAQDTRPGIAVLPIENGGSYGQDAENFEALEVGLQQMLTTEFAVNEALRVVERSRIRELMQEQDLGASGRVNPETAAHIGRLVGARYVVTGGFTDWYGDFRLDLRVVNVETGEIVRTEQVRKKRNELYGIVVEAAQNLTRGLSLPPLPQRAAQQRESREVPTEAVELYSRALLYADRGRTEQAVELFNQALERFPEFTEARQALQQLRSG